MRFVVWEIGLWDMVKNAKDGKTFKTRLSLRNDFGCFDKSDSSDSWQFYFYTIVVGVGIGSVYNFNKFNYISINIINNYNNIYRSILIHHPQRRILLVRGRWYKTVNCQNCQTFIDGGVKIFYNIILRQENWEFKRIKVGV